MSTHFNFPDDREETPSGCLPIILVIMAAITLIGMVIAIIQLLNMDYGC